MATGKQSVALIIAFVVVLAVSVRDFVNMFATITTNNFILVVGSIVLSAMLALYYKKQL